MEYLDYIRIILEIVGGCALLATQTENKFDDKLLSVIAKGINILGANWGKATNR